MASQNRTPAHGIEFTAALQREPYKFGFFQALRLFECLHREQPRIGQSQRPGEDPVRLAQEPSVSFANSTLASFEPGRAGSPPRLSSYFLGLFGPHGPLPLHLTEYARDRIRHNADPTFARFLDVFHHRMLALFYRAWANTQPAVSFDRPDADRFGAYAGSLIGIGMPSLRERDDMPDLAKLHYAGHLACQTRHAEGLESLLEDYFKIPARIREFVGEWLLLPEDGRWQLGRSPATGSLGATAILGSRVWQCQHKFRVEFGPMNLADYERMLPGGESLVRLSAIVRNYAGDEMAWDVKLILRKEEVPASKLGGGLGLGWATWMAGRNHRSDADDVVLDPMASARCTVHEEVVVADGHKQKV